MGEDADDQYTYAVVLLWAGLTHNVCGGLVAAEDLFRKSLNICTQRGFRAIEALNTVFLGLVSVLCGQPQAGLAQIRRGIESFGHQPGGLSYLALGLASDGRPDEAFSALTTAFDWAEQSGVVTELATMHQLKGRILEGKSNSKEAENSFRTAIEIARRQSAKSLELHAMTSLARLLAKQGRRDEARAMLAEIYNWFTEGFDTAT